MTDSLSTATRNQLIFWGLALAVLLLFVSVFSAVLLPFVLGLAVAYLLEPLVARLSRWKLPRAAAALLIVALFFIAVGIAAALVLPLLYREGMQLAAALPGYGEKIWVMLTPYLGWVQERFGYNDFSALQDEWKNHAGKLLGAGSGILGGLAAGGKAAASFLTTLVLTPIVAYYMMKEWPAITAWVDGLLPRRHYTVIHDLLGRINLKIAGFVRGQITVALILGVIYAAALALAGLNYGLLIGFVAGVLSVIPMVGSAIGLVAAVTVAWFQAGDLAYVALIAAIFFGGQLLEGSVLSPKLLGDSVGLHPLWIMFALLAGGALFGITGMLLAVPVTAAAGVLAGYALDLYRRSAYYTTPFGKKKAQTP